MVLPHSELGNEFSVPDLPRWALHDKHEMTELPRRIYDNGWALAHGHPTPNQDDIELVAEI